ncbi:hypothetical protein YC2023_039010 [Brassica napus]
MKFLIEWFTFGKHVTSTRVVCLWVSTNHIACYEDDLNAGVVYKIKNFLVINNKTSYKKSISKVFFFSNIQIKESHNPHEQGIHQEI